MRSRAGECGVAMDAPPRLLGSCIWARPALLSHTTRGVHTWALRLHRG